MNRLRKVVDFLLVLAFAAIAFPASADDDGGKKYTLNMAVTPPATSPATVTATFTNKNNSSFNSLTLSKPTAFVPAGSGYTITAVSSSRGTASLTATGIKVVSINLPAGTGQSVTVTMTVATTGTSCSAVSGNWTAQVYTGSSLSGSTFSQTSPSTTSTSISPGCVTVTSSSSGNGTISPTGAQTVNAGSTPSFTLTPATGYHIGTTGGTCGGSLSGNTFTTNPVATNCTVIANFVINTYQVTPSVPGGHGSLSPSTAQTVNYGATTAFTLVPATGYHVGTATGCGGSLMGSTFTTGAVTADCTVTASFAINTYTLTYGAGTGGTISGSSPQTVDYGASGSAVTALPDSGYRFVRWSDSSTANPRTDTSVSADISVTAVFAPVLSFGTQPHDALAGGYVGPVTVTATGLDGQTVTLTLGPSGPALSGNTAVMSGGVATFNSVATAPATTAQSGYYLTASVTVPDVLAVNSNTFAATASTGILTCPTDPSPPPGSVQSFTDNGTFPTSGSRSSNKEGSPCVAIPFNVQVSDSPVHLVNVNWDQLAQPNVVMEIDVMWPPELVGPGNTPKPTFYDIGFGPFVAGQCLAKSAPPAGPPEQIGTLTAGIDASQTSIPITFNGAQPAGYPFPIVIHSSTAGTDPERMLVTGADGAISGNYIVVRHTGLTPASSHSAGFAVMWTPMPIDDGSGTNAPAGAQAQTCIFLDTSMPVGLDACPLQTSEPLVPCTQVQQKMWVTGDWSVSR